MSVSDCIAGISIEQKHILKLEETMNMLEKKQVRCRGNVK